MAGEAKTSQFLLSTATLMVGPQAEVLELTPEDHSLGLIKNVQVTAETGFTELTQGVQAQVVASVNTSNQTRISGEVYEYTARNLAYGAGLDGDDYETITTEYALGAAITAGVGGEDEVTLATASASTISPGDWIVIQDLEEGDRLHVSKVASKAVDVLTLSTKVPEGQNYAIATTKVYKVNAIKIGATPKQTIKGVKLVGLMPETGEPVTLIFPKIRITKGMSLAFQTDNFTNMPFEFTPYQPVPTDPLYSDFKGGKTWMLLKR